MHGELVVVDDGSGETIAMVDAAGSEGIAVHADIAQRDDCDAMVDAAWAWRRRHPHGYEA